MPPELGGPDIFERDYFMPLYRRVIDSLHKVSPEKWAFFQAQHVTIPEHRAEGFPCDRVDVAMNREKTSYAPHYYGNEPAAAVSRYLEDAAVGGTPVFMGEYGPPTRDNTDTSLQVQTDYKLNLIRTVELFDKYVIGHVKAWWCGSRAFNASDNPHRRTWAMFYGNSQALGPERKYILDVIARPRHLFVAGTVQTFRYDFATRDFKMKFKPGKAEAPTEILVPVTRHFPDGFRVDYQNLRLAWNPENPAKLMVIENPDNLKTEQFIFNTQSERLIIDHWPDASNDDVILKIIPGWRD